MDKDKNKESPKSGKCACCCYDVVDSCGCVVGTLCCDSKDLSRCIMTQKC